MKKILMLLSVILLAACSGIGKGNEMKKMLLALNEFSGYAKVADSTPRNNLATPVTQMQRVRTETAALDVPERASKTHEYLITYMDFTIEGFLLFMEGASDGEISQAFYRAEKAHQDFLFAIQYFHEMDGLILEE